jgi:hypothetical protein
MTPRTTAAPQVRKACTPDRLPAPDVAAAAAARAASPSSSFTLGGAAAAGRRRQDPPPASAEAEAAAEWLAVAAGLLAIDPAHRLSARAALARRLFRDPARGGLGLGDLGGLPAIAEDSDPAAAARTAAAVCVRSAGREPEREVSEAG